MKKQITQIKSWKAAMMLATAVFLSEVNSYANVKLDSFFAEASQETTEVAKNAIDFITILVGLAAIVLLAVNFMKRKDGEQNSNEAIVGWLKGLIFTFIGLTVIKAIFFS